ncbi:NAD-dependent nucleoside diphosphate-sugar epimerase/dehydratase [Leptolyngbya boryana NIES-2135]|jgi:nucleoside-diphosphate-sugar epimerase|uniref:NAD-dependent nucleoside diphosphate-sugar epimerase/dehydratase n=1 Tax=Leptolyngbya boryana NIES-2135 TaxID=1973484 RepID=A0A1Z4JBC3_LEPBY|nr:MULTISPECIES: SDR family oxidoreductase [Leptolyngbya]BAY54064.1 NAD-dependent nucleoside diphosphate-sugar epimerase/dehydratase [Leptolyngbya boryana NIES-2135]MBD2369721.1 SDR family oxidoreductase [Leptolyngbya sp. FACHB-161]MBD2376078.1 SDR family oxidoreductase [Leptolyngbya sp. FACHB-238]MBD2400354.1 SDR family oxidoreductase [Leptolyngbya sp. FACHB-239]MBD2406895.1 SDR family oxidoreductase [Leptolyngbya sp. FACHB-402]
MNFLITGATGFVGSALCQLLEHSEHTVYGVVRSDAVLPPSVTPILVSSIAELDDHPILPQIDVVIHLAARVHQMNDTAADPLSEFRAVNTEATKSLAIAAATAGVKRFVYLSSIKVNGDGQASPYTERSTPQPADAYGISKWEAECALNEIAATTDLEIVILRPPLVYGAGVKANFLNLMNLVKTGIPLPLGGIHNQRSLVYVGNLVDAIVTCATHPQAAGQTFLVSDSTDVSTPELVRKISESMRKPVRLMPISPVILTNLARILGKTATLDRLFGSLTIDSSKLRQTLNWQPPFTLEQGLEQTARGFQDTH